MGQGPISDLAVWGYGSRTMPNGRLLIAVVDDEDSVLCALRRLIRSYGHDVETYASGDDFLASLEDHLPDCLLLDLHMPHITGFEVQSRISALKLGFPVLVISAKDTDECRLRAMNGGATAFLSKPVDASELLSLIEKSVCD